MGTVDAARECGLSAISANDHLVFSTPWLDGLAALAAATQRSGEMTVATTVSLVVVWGPVAGKSLAAIDILSGGRPIAGVGPGSSNRDYDAVGLTFDERWKRFEESVVVLRALLRGTGRPAEYVATPDPELAPRLSRRVGSCCGSSWGPTPASAGWPASPTAGWPRRTTRRPTGSCRPGLPGREAERARPRSHRVPKRARDDVDLVSEDKADAAQMLDEVLAPLLRRDPDELRDRLCIGSAEYCAALLSTMPVRDASGCSSGLGDEPRQIELIATEVVPRIERHETTSW